MLKDLNKKQKITIAVLMSLLIVVIGVSCVVIINSQEKLTKNSKNTTTTTGKTIVSLKSNDSISESNKNIFDVNLKMTHLLSSIYSSASFSISFDKEKIELVGIKKGDILTFSSSIPTWKYDIKSSNERGLINIMYLDLLGGRGSFTSKSIISEEKNNILALQFRLKDGAKSGDDIFLKINDVVFATIKGDVDHTSLSVKNKNINIVNCNIKIQ